VSETAEPEATGRTFIRFTPVQRVEHVVQLIMFTTLVVTGLPQRYAESRLGEKLIQTMGGIDFVQTVHRFCGYVFILETAFHVFHVAYLVFIKRVNAKSMIPGPHDAKDALHMVLYFLGLKKGRARFDRYDFRQKSEYWALIWGGFVMILTGLMMRFPIFTTQYLPGELIPAAKAAHSGEALLAALAIAVWHMYSAHLCADVFPFDTTVFTGKISEERMRHEHPLEYERILAEENAKEASESTSK
jgi:formate dehydrogenase gamma subunit